MLLTVACILIYLFNNASCHEMECYIFKSFSYEKGKFSDGVYPPRCHKKIIKKFFSGFLFNFLLRKLFFGEYFLIKFFWKFFFVKNFFLIIYTFLDEHFFR